MLKFSDSIDYQGTQLEHTYHIVYISALKLWEAETFFFCYANEMLMKKKSDSDFTRWPPVIVPLHGKVSTPTAT